MIQSILKRAHVPAQSLWMVMPVVTGSTFAFLLLQDAIRPIYLLLLQLYLAL